RCHRGPRAVELLGAARTREGLERVHAEAADVRRERTERRRTAHVSDPRATLDLGRDLGNCRVRDAEQDELGVVSADGQPTFAQPCSDGRADPAGADDLDSVEHFGSSSSVADAGQTEYTARVPARRPTEFRTLGAS